MLLTRAIRAMSSNNIHIGSHRAYSLGYQPIPSIPRNETIANKLGARGYSQGAFSWKPPKATKASSLRKLSVGDHRDIHVPKDRPRYLVLGAKPPLGIEGVKFFDPDFVERITIEEIDYASYPLKVGVVLRKPDNPLFQSTIYEYKARAGMKVFFAEADVYGIRKIYFFFYFKDDFRNRETIKGFLRDLALCPHVEKKVKIDLFQEEKN